MEKEAEGEEDEKPIEQIKSAKAALKWLFKRLAARLLCSSVSRMSLQSRA